MERLVVLFILLQDVVGSTLLATFDGAKETTWPWETVNDPVMGGSSHSTFEVDAPSKVGIWDGEVKIVQFLGAPGFCNVQAPGLYKKSTFPDVTGSTGITVQARQTISNGLSHFNVMLMTKGAKHLFKQGVYTANFTMTNAMADHFIPLSSFTCTWRGQQVSWCPAIHTQLAGITNIGVGTAFPGVAGKFHVEMASVSASQASTSQLFTSNPIDLATFDGKTQHSWKTEDDPVMGGKSHSHFEAKEGYGEYSGTCKIVPKLKAPGFTIALTENPLLAKFPDVSSAEGLILGVKNAGGNISNFKIAFCDSHINFYRCQFQSYKADISIPPSDDFKDLFVPWSKFSDKWSSYTGEHTAEDPPKPESLKSITQLQVWTEGVAGDFLLQIKYIRAGSPSGTAVFNI